MADFDFDTLGRELALEPYLERFESIQQATDCSTLKLESAQHFIEPGNESWERFVAGDWIGAIAAVNESANELNLAFKGLQDRGISTERVRLVEEPISPYLQWESHTLNLRAKAGENIRVYSNSNAAIELGIRLRELLFLHDEALFVIRYSSQGKLSGAREYDWSDSVARLEAEVRALFDRSTPFERYFQDNIADLPEPPGR